MKFKIREKDAVGNKIGPHRVGNKRYKAGDIVESNDPLDKLFKGKFDRMPETTPASAGQTVKWPGAPKPDIPGPQKAAVRDQGVESTPPGSTPPAPVKLERMGVNVTNEFPSAALAKLEVYHDPKADRYIIVDPKTGEALKKVVSEKAVTRYLKEQIG